ncbi:hypothetical protein C4F50_01200 [Flavobacterium sp. KB82]|uniref:Uncharacterized protein n=2 Tax=Flavobacterium hungaricum TaxID=2082725 RepID=A0ABR9TEP5_9FLAO|nr:hypothetical protein [Flavobacterium hungaricum]
MLLFFIPASMDGFEGWTTHFDIKDYLLLGYEIVTALLLTLFLQKQSRTVRILLLILITITLPFLFYGLYEIILFKFQNSNHNDFILLTALLLFISLSSTVWIGLFKSKIEK